MDDASTRVGRLELHVGRENWTGYLPMQNSRKTTSRRSSTPTLPDQASEGVGRPPQILGSQFQAATVAGQRITERRSAVLKRHPVPCPGHQGRLAGR